MQSCPTLTTTDNWNNCFNEKKYSHKTSAVENSRYTACVRHTVSQCRAVCPVRREQIAETVDQHNKMNF